VTEHARARASEQASKQSKRERASKRVSERERHDPRQRRGTNVSRPTGHRSTRRREASSKPAVTHARTLRPADQPRVTTAASAAAPPASAAALAAALAATLAVAFAAALAASRRYSYSEKHPPDPTPDTLPLLTLLIGLPNSQGTTLREPNTCTHADMPRLPGRLPHSALC
jgi:hypothetical protein